MILLHHVQSIGSCRNFRKCIVNRIFITALCSTGNGRFFEHIGFSLFYELKCDRFCFRLEAYSGTGNFYAGGCHCKDNLDMHVILLLGNRYAIRKLFSFHRYLKIICETVVRCGLVGNSKTILSAWLQFLRYHGLTGLFIFDPIGVYAETMGCSGRDLIEAVGIKWLTFPQCRIESADKRFLECIRSIRCIVH